ncbi:hypothetical protein [Arthrobacter sp. PAMC25564]|uniref:hypothetical protein n=1 Tax=Arthrobacter sp. PAMC25564 TaxID=2565366 RepID=UPI001F0D6936|nr:hypothetical protein [Arthrobacter sp. PAMC25564]
MTPVTNRPHLPASAGANALKTARTLTAAAAHGAAAPHASRGRLDAHHHSLVESEYVGSPYCERCGTDEFIYLETFVPAAHRRDGSISKLGEVTYFCSGCDDFSAHAVPASWVPPGWYFG